LRSGRWARAGPGRAMRWWSGRAQQAKVVNTNLSQYLLECTQHVLERPSACLAKVMFQPAHVPMDDITIDSIGQAAVTIHKPCLPNRFGSVSVVSPYRGSSRPSIWTPAGCMHVHIKKQKRRRTCIHTYIHTYMYIYIYDFTKVTPCPKLSPRGSSLNSELYVLPAYRKDTGRMPEGHRKVPSHPLSITRNLFVIYLPHPC
jgi:hypothetical protein